MRDVAFLAMMGWSPTAMRGGKVTKATLSDDTTEVDFSDTLKADVLRAIDGAKRSADNIAAFGGSKPAA